MSQPRLAPPARLPDEAQDVDPSVLEKVRPVCGQPAAERPRRAGDPTAPRHYGCQRGLTDRDLEPLFRSAEAYVAMWDRAECGPDIDGDGAGNESDSDDDGDGLDDVTEAGHGTDPLDPDCDDDGLLDGEDVEWVQSAIEGLPVSSFRTEGNRVAMLSRLAGVEATTTGSSPAPTRSSSAATSTCSSRTWPAEALGGKLRVGLARDRGAGKRQGSEGGNTTKCSPLVGN